MPLTTPSIYPPGSRVIQKFASRRSVVHSTKGIVACTQPLAAKCGIDILNAGGNAADAAVAVAAGMNMTEPCSTGIGGDMFCLYYDAATGQVSAMNGSGRSGAKCTLETIRADLGIADGEVGKIPMESVHAVTVPGAAAGWVDTVERFGSGKLTMEQILAPAIELGEKGYPVSELTSYFWERFEARIRSASPNFKEWLKVDPSAPDGVRAPRPGDIMKNPYLARTFRTLAKEGKKGFYTGRIAEELVKVCRDLGGHLELDDLAHHLEMGSEPVEPICLEYRVPQPVPKKKNLKRDANGDIKLPSPSSAATASNGGEVKPPPSPTRNGGSSGGSGGGGSGVKLWEHPPNGQGIVALMALGILQALQAEGKVAAFTAADFNTAPYLHAVVESLRIAFADASWYVTDPNTTTVPTAELLAPAYLAERAQLFSAERASPVLSHGDPYNKDGGRKYRSPALQSSDTVYFAVSDGDGNAVSFINSNYGGFGTCIIPRGCGFTLQNRAANFSLDADHPNVLEPRKRPYHTIIPGLVTNMDADGDGDGDGDSGGSRAAESLHSVFGVMGGYMQPQGHVQTLLGQLVGGLNPQQALDAPRVCIGAGLPEEGDVYDMTVYVEEGMDDEAVEGLRALGHSVKVVSGMGRAMFGRGQIIRWTVDEVEGTGVWSAGSDLRGDGAAYPA